jgi:hypothetical protein
MTATAAETEVMTYREALRLAPREELARDERVFVMGEEVGVFEGAYRSPRVCSTSSGPTACATPRHFEQANRRSPIEVVLERLTPSRGQAPGRAMVTQSAGRTCRKRFGYRHAQVRPV